MPTIERKWRIEHVSTADDAGCRACVISGSDLTAEDAGIEVVPAEQLRGAVEAMDEAITTLALLRGYIDPGEKFDSEPWQAINTCVRSLTNARGQ